MGDRMIQDDMTCSKCGNKVDVSHKFCTRCGYVTIYNEDIKNCDSSVVCGSIDNDVEFIEQNSDDMIDDGKNDAIKSLRYFSIYCLYIMLCINAFIESKKLSADNASGYGFLIVFGGFFVLFSNLYSCVLGCSALSKYNKCCNIKSSSRKKLNTLNIISLFLMGLFFLAIIFMFLGFKFLR